MIQIIVGHTGRGSDCRAAEVDMVANHISLLWRSSKLIGYSVFRRTVGFYLSYDELFKRINWHHLCCRTQDLSLAAETIWLANASYAYASYAPWGSSRTQPLVAFRENRSVSVNCDWVHPKAQPLTERSVSFCIW